MQLPLNNNHCTLFFYVGLKKTTTALRIDWWKILCVAYKKNSAESAHLTGKPEQIWGFKIIRSFV